MFLNMINDFEFEVDENDTVFAQDDLVERLMQAGDTSSLSESDASTYHASNYFIQKSKKGTINQNTVQWRVGFPPDYL